MGFCERRGEMATKGPRSGTAAIYARFSSSKQREASIEDQLRVCRGWCASHGYSVVAEYCDHARSGRSDDRPEFQRMVANAGESEVVVVYMMDRFSRDRYDAPIYKKRLRDAGTRVVSATEAMPDGPEAMIIESVYEAMAAMESAHTAQRTRRGMEGNALRCMHNGVTVFGYGFGEDGRYVVDEGQAEVVREVFARRAAGEAIGSIAADLARRGYRTHHGNPASYSMVRNMLGNEKYVGTYSWGGTRVEGGMPAIVTREEFEMAGRARSGKVRADEEWGDFAFAGRGVCLGCGMNLVGVSGRGRHNVKYSYYRCSKRCGCRPVRADWLENAVADELRAMLGDEERAREVARAVGGAITDKRAEVMLKEAQRALSDAQRGISNILKAVEDGMPYAEVSERLSELRSQRDRAEADVRAWEDRSTLDEEDFARFLMGGAGLTDRQLLDAFVWQVRVGDDRVVAILNYDVKGEPARLEYARGFELDDLGSPNDNFFEPGRRATVAIVSGLVAICFPRAA